MFENLPVSENSPMTFKMDYGVPMTPFDTPQSLNYALPMASRRASQDQRPIIQLQDASTFEGQQLGAILAVKRTSRVTNFSPPLAKVGDYVETLAYYNVNQVEVRSIRTGMTGTIEWEDLLPVPYDEKCGCLNGGCRCVYETWQAYSARRPLPELQIPRTPVYRGQDLNGTYGMDFDFSMMQDWGQVHHAFTSTYSSPASVLSQMPLSPNRLSQNYNTQPQTLTEVADPLTLKGQTPGAILAIKQHPYCPADGSFGPVLETQIGDCVKFIGACEGGWGKVKVRNLRTGKDGFLRWESFKPVNTRNTCSCHKAYCYCEYEDFDKSREYCEARK